MAADVRSAVEGALEGLKAKKASERRLALERIRVLVEDEATSEWLHAHSGSDCGLRQSTGSKNGRPAGSSWAVLVGQLLLYVEQWRDSTRSTNASVIREGVITLRAAVARARGKAGILSDDLMRDLFDFVQLMLGSKDHFAELGPEYIQILRGLFSAQRDHPFLLDDKRIERSFLLSFQRLNKMYHGSAPVNPTSHMADVLRLCWQSVDYAVSEDLLLRYFQALQDWLDCSAGPHSKTQRNANHVLEFADSDRDLLEVLCGLLECVPEDVFPALAAHASMVPEYCISVAAKLPSTSPLRHYALRALQLQIELFQRHVRAWNGSHGLGSAGFDKQLEQLFGALFAAPHGGSRLAGVAASFDYDLEVASWNGYYVHLSLATDLLQLLPNRRRADELVKKAIDNLPSLSWAQFLFVLCRRHPIQDPAFERLLVEALVRSLDIQAKRLQSHTSSAQHQRELVWVLRTIKPCALSSSRSPSWPVIWNLVVLDILPRVAPNIQHTCLEAAVALLNTPLVDSQEIRPGFPVIWDTAMFAAPPVALPEKLFKAGTAPQAVKKGRNKRRRIDKEVEGEENPDKDLEGNEQGRNGGTEHEDADRFEEGRVVLVIKFMTALLRRIHLHESTIEHENDAGGSRARSRHASAPPSQSSSSSSQHVLSPLKRRSRKRPFSRTLSSLSSSSSSRSLFLDSGDEEEHSEPEDVEEDRPNPRSFGPREVLLRWVIKWVYCISVPGQVVSVDMLRALAVLLGLLVSSGDVRLKSEDVNKAEMIFDMDPARLKSQDLALGSLSCGPNELVQSQVNLVEPSALKRSQRLAQSALGVVFERLQEPESSTHVTASCQYLLVISVLAGALPQTLAFAESLRKQVDSLVGRAAVEIPGLLGTTLQGHFLRCLGETPEISQMAQSPPADEGREAALESIFEYLQEVVTQPGALVEHNKSKRDSRNGDNGEDDEFDRDVSQLHGGRVAAEVEVVDDDDGFADEFESAQVPVQHKSLSSSSLLTGRSSTNISRGRDGDAAGRAPSGPCAMNTRVLSFAESKRRIGALLRLMLFLTSSVQKCSGSLKFILDRAVEHEHDLAAVLVLEEMCRVSVLALECRDDSVVKVLKATLVRAWKLIEHFQRNANVLIGATKVLQDLGEALCRLQCPRERDQETIAANIRNGCLRNTVLIDTEKGPEAKSRLAAVLPDGDHVIPEKARLQMLGAVTAFVQLWVETADHSGVSFGMWVLLFACLDQCSVSLRRAAVECVPAILVRAKPEDELSNLLHTFLKCSHARVMSHTGIPHKLPDVDLTHDPGCSSGSATPSSSQASSDSDSRGERDPTLRLYKMTRDCALVHTNWKLLANLACEARELLRPVLFRLVLFARNGSDASSQIVGNLAQLRWRYVQALVEKIRVAHAYRSTNDLFCAHLEFLVINWVKYCPANYDVVDMMDRRLLGGPDDADGGSTIDPIDMFPFQVFGFTNEDDFLNASERALVSASALRFVPEPNNWLKTRLEARNENVWDTNVYHVCGALQMLNVAHSAAVDDDDEEEDLAQRFWCDHDLVPDMTDPDNVIQAVKSAITMASLDGGGFGRFVAVDHEILKEWLAKMLPRDAGSSVNPIDVILHVRHRFQICSKAGLGPMISVLQCVLDWLDDRATEPLVLLIVVHLLLWALRTAPPDLSGELATCLSAWIKRCTSNSPRAFSDSCLVTLQTLVDLELNSSDPAKEHLHTCMHVLVSNAVLTKNGERTSHARALLQEDAKSLIPRDRFPEICNLLDQHLDLRFGSNGGDPVSRFVRLYRDREATERLFLGSSPVVHAPLCLAVLSQVNNACRDSLEAMVESRVLPDLVSTLAELAGMENHQALRNAASQCLGVLGAFDPRVSDLFESHISIGRKEMETSDGFQEVVGYLVASLVSDDSAVAHSAAEGLEGLAHNPSNTANRKVAPQLKSKTQAFFRAGGYSHRKGMQRDPYVAQVLGSALSKFSKATSHVDVWALAASVPFDAWICELAFRLCERRATRNLQDCAALCAIDSRFATLMLPTLVFQIVENTDQKHVEHLAREYSKLLHPQTMQTLNLAVLRSLVWSLLIVRARYVRAVLKMGGFRTGGRPIFDPLHMRLSGKHLAEACLQCKMPSSALLFLSLAGETRDEPLYFEAYQRLDSVDDLRGVQQNTSLMDFARLSHVRSDWFMSLRSADGLLQHVSEGSSELHGMVAESLRHLGMYNLFAQYVQTNCDDPGARFEAGWRSLDAVEHRSTELDRSLHRVLYHGLAALVEGDRSRFMTVEQQGRLELTRDLQEALGSKECTQQVQKTMQEMQLLHELGKVWHLRWRNHQRNVNVTCDIISRQVERWDNELEARGLNFDHAEPLMALRSSMLRAVQLSFASQASRDQAGAEEPFYKHILSITKFARRHNRVGHARNWLSHLNSQQLPHLEARTVLEKACILWQNGEQDSAIRIAESLAARRDLAGKAIRAEALLSAGEWLFAQSSKPSNEILEELLTPAVDEAERVKDDALVARSRQATARVVDQVYRALHARFQLPEYQRSRKFAEEKKAQLALAKAKLASLKSGQKRKEYHQLVSVDSRRVELENQRHENELQTYELLLLKSIKAYARALQTERDSPASFVFRLVALWFENVDNEKVPEIIRSEVLAVPTSRLVPLLYQIASRVGSNNKVFDELIQEVLFRVGDEHPFQTTPHLFALKNADWIPRDKKFAQFAASTNVAKQAAAKKIFERLARTSKFKEQVTALDSVLRAFTELAYFDALSVSAKSSNLSRRTLDKHKEVSRHKAHSVRDCVQFQAIMSAYKRSKVRVPSPIANLPPMASYDAVETLEDVHEEFTFTASGINMPKVVRVRTSHGVMQKFLVKGSDDLRQDAVMEQLFGLVDELLQGSPETARAKLRIRTYKVVPLTPVAGIIEWVNDTIPMGAYLYHDDSNSKAATAHQRYRRKNDMSSDECRKLMAHAQTRKIALSVKRDLYDKICKRFHPVMRHFFLERFPLPTEWFARQSAYARSTAVASVVGYIFGVGDRHLHNILIDQKTAEVVHIDFGVTFESGRTLRIMERVPFRLTRDVVDGMGVNGTDGVFLSGAEKTMAVMRRNAESLLTICKVFVYDPLYDWTISPAKADDLQPADKQQQLEQGDDDLLDSQKSARTARSLRSTSSSSSSASGVSQRQQPPQQRDSSAEADQRSQVAESVLLRVEQKLQGREHSNGDSLNVQGQVRHLIREAQDRENLAQMFYGWAPFC